MLGVDFYRENYPRGGKFLEGEHSRGKVTLDDLKGLQYERLL